jgi:hypothetical protein
MLNEDVRLRSFRETLIDLSFSCSFESHEEYLIALLRTSIGGNPLTAKPSYLEISNMIFNVSDLLKLIRSLDQILDAEPIELLPGTNPVYVALKKLDFDLVMDELTISLRIWIHNDDPDYCESLVNIARLAILYENINNFLRLCYEFVDQDEITRDLKQKERQCV